MTDRPGPDRPATEPRRGRPTRAEAEAIDERLRGAAIEAFVTKGFDGATMEAIAITAAVTKRTLYARYPDKQALFAAVVPRALADMPFPRLDFDLPDGDLATVLRSSAHEMVDRLIDPDAVRLRRFAMLEARRLAALDQAGNADLWSQSLRSLVDLLHDRAARGEISIDDPEAAADLFVSMVAGGPTIRADMGVVDSPAEVTRHIDAAVDLFLHGVVPHS